MGYGPGFLLKIGPLQIYLKSTRTLKQLAIHFQARTEGVSVSLERFVALTKIRHVVKSMGYSPGPGFSQHD